MKLRLKVKKMNSITRYRNDIDSSLKKIKNNINYLENFGNAYIPQKINDYLEPIYAEMEKLRDLVIEQEDTSIELEPIEINE